MEREADYATLTEGAPALTERATTRRGFLRWPGRAVASPRAITTTIPIPPKEATTSEATITGARPKLVVTRHTSVDGPAAESLWEVYRANFEPLTELAILEHLYDREEILAELVNPRITKVVGWEGDRPVGFGMVTNELEIVPQISPAFLRAQYPELAARNAIHYGILVLVSPEHRRRTLFARLCTELNRIAADDRGVLVFDTSRYTREQAGVDAMTLKMSSHFPGASFRIIDQQTWYAVELPNPMPDQGSSRYRSMPPAGS